MGVCVMCVVYVSVGDKRNEFVCMWHDLLSGHPRGLLRGLCGCVMICEKGRKKREKSAKKGAQKARKKR